MKIVECETVKSTRALLGEVCMGIFLPYLPCCLVRDPLIGLNPHDNGVSSVKCKQGGQL